MALNHKVVFVGGGTAGHVLPLLAVAQDLKNKMPQVRLYYFGSGQPLEKSEVSGQRIKYFKIQSGKWRRNLGVFILLRNAFDLIKTSFGLFQSIYLLVQIRPSVVVSKGGFVSVPVSIASGILRIPLIIHESDLQMGLANRVALRFASRVGTAFPVTMYSRAVQRKAFYSGVPLRKEFVRPRCKISNEHILIMGGSLGARKLNELVFAIGEKLLSRHKVVHITGKAGYEAALKYRESLPKGIKARYRVFDYSSDMAKLISSAKLVISRAGASSIFEIGSFGKRAILVPIEESVAPHQKYNAHILKKAGFVEVFEQDQDAEKLLALVEKSLKGKPGTASLSFKYSSRLMADEIIEQIERRRLDRYGNIFLVGVEGVSMKGLKYIFEKMGKRVSGSDAKAGGHSRSNITDDLDLVVYSSAVSKRSEGYVEIEEAIKKRIPTMKRSEAIGIMMKGRNGISVSGMHGKTTISLLLARIFELDGRRPTYLVGAPNAKSNPAFEYGPGKDFVAEACEYDDSFLDFTTSSAIISNIEREHLDYFKGGLEEIKKHFVMFCNTIKPGGALLYCIDDKNTVAVTGRARPLLVDKNISMISYGFSPKADFKIVGYKIENGLAKFSIRHGSHAYSVITSIVGRHFAKNATAAFALSVHHGVGTRTALAAIAEFTGAKRRMEFVSRTNGMSFYDDYGHHPTEIAVTTEAFSQMYPKARKVLIYEPHQQNRFNDLYDDFFNVFAKTKFDIVGILPVHRVEGRDSKTGKTSRDLVKKLAQGGRGFVFLDSYRSGVRFFHDNLKKGDIVVTMGATDVYKITEQYLRGLKYE